MSLINWSDKPVECDESQFLSLLICNVVIVNDVSVDVKCEIMLANHNKSQ